MSQLLQLRQATREIFDETLRAVDAGDAVRRAIVLKDSRLMINGDIFDLADRQVYSIGIGKAAFATGLTLEDILGDALTAGFLSAPFPGPAAFGDKRMHEWKLRTRLRFCEGGHPIPNNTSLIAAKSAFALLEKANSQRALLIFLISGGGSSMLEWPVMDEISLGDLRIANKILVSCGASISEINAVRRAFSAVKGGKLAARAPDCDQITLIVSDVPPGEEWNVASGPTVTLPLDAPKASDVIAKYGLDDRLPEPILRALKAETEPLELNKSGIRRHIVLLSNRNALEAAAEAARQRGFIVEIAAEVSDQPIEEGCKILLEQLASLRDKHRHTPSVVCLISGGEFACPVRGDGIGGRNQETAMRLALSSNLISPMVGLCAGTDGIDGNSPAAGAIIDSTTIERAKSVALDAEDFLRRSDAYSFFVALGDAVTTGPTGTNVRDLRILLSQV